MDERKLKPALTAEEWADWCAGVKRVDEFQRDYLRRSMFDDHGTAALLLLGQPFGFTREMVDVLRHEAESEWRGLPSPNPGDVLSAVADRIEALLPPERPDPGA